MEKIHLEIAHMVINASYYAACEDRYEALGLLTKVFRFGGGSALGTSFERFVSTVQSISGLAWSEERSEFYKQPFASVFERQHFAGMDVQAVAKQLFTEAPATAFTEAEQAFLVKIAKVKIVFPEYGELGVPQNKSKNQRKLERRKSPRKKV